MKLVGKVTWVDFTTFRYCKKCEATVKKRGDYWWCPNCGLIGDYRETRRRYELSLGLDVFDTQVICVARNHDINQFLFPMTLQEWADELAQFRGASWSIKFRQIKTMIQERLLSKYEDTVVKLDVRWLNGERLLIKRVTPIGLKGEKAFIEGTQHELLEVTRSVLGDHEEKLELWGDTPILRYTKNIREENVEVGVRAPVAEYGKAYRVWVRVNDVHMIPTTPVYTGGPHRCPAYVYRTYHTKNWKENLTDNLKYCVSKEDFLVNVVKASKAIYEGEENLWDLVDRISRFDREAGIRILQRHGLLQNNRC